MKMSRNILVLVSLLTGLLMMPLHADDTAPALPAAETANERTNPGTLMFPNTWSDESRVGDINAYIYNGKRMFFKARRDGRPSQYNWYYPQSETDNGYWEYHSTHAGTFDDPKQWHEYSYKGDIHRYEYGDKVLFFKALQEGVPAKHNWYYPPTEQDGGNLWTYMGRHAGTWQDPKTWHEPTWPGAIHRYAETNLMFRSKVTGDPSRNNWHYPVTPVSNAYWEFISVGNSTFPRVIDFGRPFDKYTWVTAHNGYLDALRPQLDRGVRGFMLDLHTDDNGVVRMCHKGASERCSTGDPSLKDALADVFIPYLRANSNAVITLLFESYVTQAHMQRVFDQVQAVGEFAYFPDRDATRWPTLEAMIKARKRLVFFSDNQSPGEYRAAGRTFPIYHATSYQIENTYNLGDTVLIHKWECPSRYGSGHSERNTPEGLTPLFVLNQFHSWGSSVAHAGMTDNNLTWLQRRVERYCSGPTGGRTPNYLAIDFSQTGDAFNYAAALSQGGIYFYEGNNANRDGDTVCVLPGNQASGSDKLQYSLGLPALGCENDEIRSLELEGIRAGTRIELYDSRSGDRQDDFTLIDVKQSVPMGTRVRIDSLEGSADSFYYSKIAARNNGLDGKVSLIRVRDTPPADDMSDALIVFHEGNNASQNIVCTVPYETARSFRMGSGNNNYGCDNDEIRSAVVLKARQGSSFVVAGNPNGSNDQGRTVVTFKRNRSIPITIASFNTSYENADVKVEVYKGNLDGKISHGSFNP